jgi:hypothetical protein
MRRRRDDSRPVCLSCQSGRFQLRPAEPGLPVRAGMSMIAEGPGSLVDGPQHEALSRHAVR